jgi:hypothetical protein
LNCGQKQAEKRIHQRNAGQGLVFDLDWCPRLAIAATSVGAVEHQVDDDECETGQNARQLCVTAGHDRDVEPGPQRTRIRELSCRHRRNISRSEAILAVDR